MSTTEQVSTNKIDRRVLRTRRLLQDSLIALILAKGYDAITVQEITDHANLGRATFYLHYRDKEELLISALDEIFNDLVKKMTPVSKATLQVSMPPGVVIAFQHAQQNRDLYRVMLSGQGIIVIGRRLREYLTGIIHQRIVDMLAYLPDNAPSFPVDVLTQHVVGSLVSLITWWVENDTSYTPEQMATMFQQLNGPQALLAKLGITLADENAS